MNLGRRISVALIKRDGPAPAGIAAVRRVGAAVGAAAVIAVAGLPVAAPAATAQEQAVAATTPWVIKKNYAKARLIAGRIVAPSGAAAGSGAATAASEQPMTYAGVELAVADGFKTYWRNTGDAAGAPPYFDFEGSSNVKSVKVLYPAPHRFATPDGDSIGYKGNIIFPISLTPKDAAKPITLKLTMDYGVCNEICVPARARFSVRVAPGETLPLLRKGPLVEALAKVPQPTVKSAADAAAAAATGKRPFIAAAKAEGLSGKNPKVVFDVVYPAGIDGADLFVEGPEEAFVPQPKRLAAKDGRVTYLVDLKDGADLKELKGKPLRLTLVSAKGSTEVSWILR